MEITNNQIQTATLEDSQSNRVKVVDLKKEIATDTTNTETALVPASEQQTLNQAGNLQVAVSQINDHVQNLQRNLQFTVDDLTGKDIVTVIDRESEEVIRQIPSEEALQLARRLAESREDGVQLFSTLA